MNGSLIVLGTPLRKRASKIINMPSAIRVQTHLPDFGHGRGSCIYCAEEAKRANLPIPRGNATCNLIRCFQSIIYVSISVRIPNGRSPPCLHYVKRKQGVSGGCKTDGLKKKFLTNTRPASCSQQISKKRTEKYDWCVWGTSGGD